MVSRDKPADRAQLEALRSRTEAGEGAAAAGGGASPREPERALDATQDALDKVRDILVGSQLRQQDVRFGQLEEKLFAQMAAFQEQGRQQLERLEGFVKTEFAALSQRVTGEVGQLTESLKRAQEEARNGDRAAIEKIEQNARSVADEARAGVEKISQELRAADGALEGRLAAWEGQQAATSAELRGQVFEQIKTAGEQAAAQKTELLALIEKLGADLRAAKPDRAVLAGLFSEMAGRLQG